MGATAPFRHRLHIDFTAEHAATCTCGGRWVTVEEGVAHVRAARRYRYLGVEVHYDERYYMWEHALTGHRYAWLEERYVRETVR